MIGMRSLTIKRLRENERIQVVNPCANPGFGTASKQRQDRIGSQDAFKDRLNSVPVLIGSLELEGTQL